MTVKDLKKALEKCKDSAKICVEVSEDCSAYKVIEYDTLGTVDNPGKSFVYICDSEEYLDTVMNPNIKTTIYTEN